MADQYVRGTVRDERVNRRQVGEKKQANWFESVVTGVATPWIVFRREGRAKI
jgi:hypothetical protein